MSRTDQPRLDLEWVKAQIRQDAARLRAAEAPDTERDQLDFNWLQVQCRLLGARRLAEAEQQTPQLWRFPGPLRWLARQAARAFLYMAQLITMRQAQFNHSLLDTVSDVAAGMRQAQEGLAQQQEQLRRLDAALGRLLAQGRKSA